MLAPLALFALLEAQVFGVYGDHVVVPGIGMFLLCVYVAFVENRGGVRASIKLSLKEKIFVASFAAVLFYGISLPLPSGIRYGFLLALTMICVAGRLLITHYRQVEGNKGGRRPPSLTEEGVRIASLLLVIIVIYHLGEQIKFSLAFQPAIVTSCLVLYGLRKSTASKPSKEDAGAGYIIRNWAKYWNVFIGMWCVMLMHDNGIFTTGQEHFIILTYGIMLFVIYLGALRHLSARELLWITFGATLLCSMNPVTTVLFGMEIPAYVRAFMFFLAFDLGTIFMLRQFPGDNLQAFALKKSLAYLLAALYIFQIHGMTKNPSYDLEVLAARINSIGNAGYASVLNEGNDAPVTGVIVEDEENSFFRKGTTDEL